jgi:hypothetical protein
MAYAFSIPHSWVTLIEGMKASRLLSDSVSVRSIGDGQRCVVLLADPREAKSIQKMCLILGKCISTDHY